jgi:rhodanese-related sulfurtransferase
MAVFLIWLSLIGILGTWCPVAHAGHEFDETIDTVKPEQVKLFLGGGEKLVLVDLRPVKEFKEKRLPGAVSIPVTELDRRFSEIPRAGRVVLYCGCAPGGADESYSYLYLREKGYRNVTIMEGGFSDWLKRNFPVEAGR